MRPLINGRALLMENQADSYGTIIGKILAIWAFIGVTTWSELSSFLACVLTFYILCRYLWRDIARPFCERRGWIQPRGERGSQWD